MRKFIFLIVLIAISCNESPVPEPDNLLEEDVMIDILFDTALLQASEAYMPQKLTDNKIRIKNYIYSKYEIDSATYYQNQRYYASDFKRYKRMYKKVSEKLEKLKIETDTLVSREKENDVIEKKLPSKKRKFTGSPLIEYQDTLSSQ